MPAIIPPIENLEEILLSEIWVSLDWLRKMTLENQFKILVVLNWRCYDQIKKSHLWDTGKFNGENIAGHQYVVALDMEQAFKITFEKK